MRIFPFVLLGMLLVSVVNGVLADGLSAKEKAEQKRLFFGRDQRTKIYQTAFWPWQAIGQIETQSGNLCTATLISPHLALTAGHCVLAPPGNIDKAVVLRFIPHQQKWQYELTKIETLVNSNLGKKLQPDGEGWIIPSSAAAYDFALIRLPDNVNLPIKMIPLWSGSEQELTQALSQSAQRVTQAGYPEDHLNELYSHRDCLITGWAQAGVLAHRCNTLSGDSGSPLLLKTDQDWSLIAIQSSAPAAKDRNRADNRALAVTAIRQALLQLSTH